MLLYGWLLGRGDEGLDPQLWACAPDLLHTSRLPGSSSTLLNDPTTKGLMLGLAGDFWDPGVVQRPTSALTGQHLGMLGFNNLLIITVFFPEGKPASTENTGEKLSHLQMSDCCVCF